MKKYNSIKWALSGFCCFLLLFSSCKNKKGSPALTREDSIAIYKVQFDAKEKIYYMKLSQKTIDDLFTSKQPGGTPNDVKQLQFSWHSYPGNEYGLDVSGVDEKGKQLTGPVSLEIPDKNRYVTNWNDLKREELYVVNRGSLKYLFNSTQQRSNTPMEAGVTTDIIFIPEVREFSPTIETMFFSIKKSPTDLGKLFAAGSVIYTNPSPPYNSVCDTECDY